jgi:hypothetical protein
MKNPFMKYKNPDKRCTYPFEPSLLGYCWGYATKVDEGKKMATIVCAKRCEFWEKKTTSGCKQ